MTQLNWTKVLDENGPWPDEEGDYFITYVGPSGPKVCLSWYGKGFLKDTIGPNKFYGLFDPIAWAPIKYPEPWRDEK